MTKLTKEQKRDIRVIEAKTGEDINFSDALAVVDSAMPMSASSIGRRKSPSPYVSTLTSLPGSRPMAVGIKRKQIGFFDTPCFIR